MGDATATVVTRRVMRKFTDEQRAQMVAESYATGVSMSEVARRHGVRPNLLSYWRMLSRTTGQTTKQVTKSKPSATLAAVRVSAPTRATGDGVIEIDLASCCVRVRGVVDGALLREVLAAAR